MPGAESGAAAERASCRKRPFSEASTDAATPDLDPRWLERSNVERRPASGLTKSEFVEKYETPGVPVIVTGVVPQWRAFREWTPERLAARFGDVRFRVSATHEAPLVDFLSYAASPRCEEAARPEYLFDRDFAVKCPQMEEEFCVPEYFSDDLMGLLGPDRPDYRWLIIGPRRSGSSFHVDPNANFAWNATIHGSKKWVLYPPSSPPPLTPGDDHQQSLPDWFRDHYDDDGHAEHRMECITRAGEILYVPRGWWHCVVNLELSVALAHNVVTTQNLTHVLDFLDQDKIPCTPGSGCRSRTKFNFSGDVPTSVIFPARNDDEEDDEDDDEEDDDDDDDKPCACSVEHARLNTRFRAALEEKRPELLAVYQATTAARASTWTKLKGPGPSGAQPAFSFSFAVE